MFGKANTTGILKVLSQRRRMETNKLLKFSLALVEVLRALWEQMFDLCTIKIFPGGPNASIKVSYGKNSKRVISILFNRMFRSLEFFLRVHFQRYERDINASEERQNSIKRVSQLAVRLQGAIFSHQMPWNFFYRKIRFEKSLNIQTEKIKY